MKKKNKLDIIYEDKYILVVNKPSKLLTVATTKEKERTLFHEVITYLHKKNQKGFIVHRLDKDTSGLIIFAKSMQVKTQLQTNWTNVIRKYYAVVEGEVTHKETIKSYLKETKTLYTYITDDKKDGKLAITKIEPIVNNKKLSLIDIDILTGRKNQIRVQLNSINHPIIGDKKYGSKINPINRMALHAYLLEFIHPVNKQKMILKTDIPKTFKVLFNL